MTTFSGHVQFMCVSDKLILYLLSVNEKMPMNFYVVRPDHINHLHNIRMTVSA